MLATLRLKIRPFWDSDLKNRYCVAPENIHTPTTEGIGNSEGGGGVRGSGNSRGEGGSGFTNTPKLLDDSTEVMEGVTLTPEIFGNKQGAAWTPEIFGNKHSFVPTFFATNTIYVNCKRCKP